VEISFMEYFRVGALITVITLVIGIAILAIEVRIAQGAEQANAVKGAIRGVTVLPADEARPARHLSIALLCDTDAKRTQGLQGFRPLKLDEAALFEFQKPEPVAFWMGSVSFPIDIAFVGPDMRVFRVYPDCRPGSRDRYPSFSRAAWVVETAAGSGIRAGDRIRIDGRTPLP